MADTPDPGWVVKDFDPDDEAPEGDPDHDCTGEPEDGS